MDNIVVRKIVSSEIVQVKELFETIFGKAVFGHAPAFEEATCGEEIYAALMDDRIVGFASVWEPDRFIHYLCVSPAVRHKKVGSTLVSSLAEIYGVPLTLKCLAENKDGLAFYRATGWEKVGEGVSGEGAYVLLRYCAAEL